MVRVHKYLPSATTGIVDCHVMSSGRTDAESDVPYITVVDFIPAPVSPLSPFIPELTLLQVKYKLVSMGLVIGILIDPLLFCAEPKVALFEMSISLSEDIRNHHIYLGMGSSL